MGSKIKLIIALELWIDENLEKHHLESGHPYVVRYSIIESAQEILQENIAVREAGIKDRFVSLVDSHDLKPQYDHNSSVFNKNDFQLNFVLDSEVSNITDIQDPQANNYVDQSFKEPDIVKLRLNEKDSNASSFDQDKLYLDQESHEINDDEILEMPSDPINFTDEELAQDEEIAKEDTAIKLQESQTVTFENDTTIQQELNDASNDLQSAQENPVEKASLETNQNVSDDLTVKKATDPSEEDVLLNKSFEETQSLQINQINEKGDDISIVESNELQDQIKQGSSKEESFTEQKEELSSIKNPISSEAQLESSEANISELEIKKSSARIRPNYKPLKKQNEDKIIAKKPSLSLEAASLGTNPNPTIESPQISHSVLRCTDTAKQCLQHSDVLALTALPLYFEGDKLVIAVSDIEDQALKNKLILKTGKKIKLIEHPKSEIRRSIEKEYGIFTDTADRDALLTFLSKNPN